MSMFDIATHKRDVIALRVQETAAKLKGIPGVGTGTLGLTPDAVKQSPEYREARRDYENAHHALREYNSWYVKQFKTELREARNNRSDR